MFVTLLSALFCRHSPVPSLLPFLQENPMVERRCNFETAIAEPVSPTSRKKRRLFLNGRMSDNRQSPIAVFSFFFLDDEEKTKPTTTMMDYSLFRSLYKVQAFVAQVPTGVHNLLPLPWKGGRRSFILDEECIQVLLDASASNRKGVGTPNLAINPPSVSNITSPSSLLDEASTNLTPCFDQEKKSDKGHVLVPYVEMVDWIISSSYELQTLLQHCQAYVYKKTMIGIATS
jgi:hypothetical protein